MTDGGALLACGVREELALDVEGRQIEDAEVGRPAPTIVFASSSVVMAADERGTRAPARTRSLSAVRKPRRYSGRSSATGPATV